MRYIEDVNEKERPVRTALFPRECLLEIKGSATDLEGRWYVL